MRTPALIVAVALGALVCAGTAEASPAFCAPSMRSCARVVVPLDRTGTVPGRISLQVERSRARKPTRPPLFLIAGGPGQSSTGAFDRDSVSSLLGKESTKRDVYVVDPRGTGDSGVLNCKALQAAEAHLAAPALACAGKLGFARGFYTARDSADDLDDVRRALGFDRIALLGISYGTRVALTYARRHPAHVDRVILDSTVGADPAPDPLERSTFHAMPRVLRALCADGACRASTKDPVRDIARLSARLERRPLRGAVVDARGRRRAAAVTATDLHDLLLVGDVVPALRNLMPGLVRNALRGDPAPILRTLTTFDAAEAEPTSAKELSLGAYAAALCEESPLPWSRTAPVADRLRQARAYVAAQPRSAFSPFGRATALAGTTLDLCRKWPERPQAPLAGGVTPTRVPFLILSGEVDLRTPLGDARAVARAGLTRAHVLAVPYVGHDTIDSDESGCAVRAVRRFLASGSAPRRCVPDREQAPNPTAPLPLGFGDLRASKRTPGRAGRTVAGVDATLDDVRDQVSQLLLPALLSSLFGDGAKIRAGGLRGGRVVFDLKKSRLTLDDVVLVPGLRLSGRIDGFLKPKKRRGALQVEGSSAAPGGLTLRGSRVRGRLASTPVNDRISLGGPNLDFSIETLNIGLGKRGGCPPSAARLRQARRLAPAELRPMLGRLRPSRVGYCPRASAP